MLDRGPDPSASCRPCSGCRSRPRWCCGSPTAARARATAVACAALHLALTAVVVASGLTEIQDDPSLAAGSTAARRRLERVFAPQFVPGDPLPDGKPSYSTTYDLLPIYGTVATRPTPQRVKLGAAQFFIGLDGLNVWLVALASFMMVPVVLVSWDTVREREGAYYAWLFLLQAGLLGRVPVVRPPALLRLLRADAGAAVLPDRRLGAGPEPAGRGPQVLPVHPGRQPHHAARRGRDRALRLRPDRRSSTFSLPRLADLVQTGMLQKARGDATAPGGTRRRTCSWPWPSGSRSRSRSCRSTPGCRGPTPRPRSASPSCSRRCWPSSARSASCASACRSCPDATLAVGMPLVGVLARHRHRLRGLLRVRPDATSSGWSRTARCRTSGSASWPCSRSTRPG